MINIVYRDVPVGILEDSTIEFSNQQSFVDVTKLKNEVIEADKYGTLEQDYYLLDGTYITFPDENPNVEYISEEMSNEEGIFNIPIVMTRTFENRYSATGLTIKFDTLTGDYCTELEVKWYRGDTLLETKMIYPTSSEIVAQQLIEAFDRMEIVFYKTSKPYRYLRINYLIDGLVRNFDHEELSDVEIVEEISDTGETLPINTLDVSLILKDTGIKYLFQNKQPLKVYRDNDLFGTFFIDNAKQESGKVKISAIDYIGIIDSENTKGGMFTNEIITNILDEILGESIPYELDDALSSSTITGYIPITSKREALLYVAFILGAIIDTSRSDKIEIKSIDNTIKSTLGNNKVFLGGSLEYNSLTTEVIIKEHNYEQVSTATVLFDNVLDGTVKIELSEPYHSFSITNGTIVSSNANYIEATGTGSIVTITGQSYILRNKSISINNPLTTFSTISKSKKIESVMLINSTNSGSIVNRIPNQFFNNRKIKCQAIINDEKVGNVVNIATKEGIKKAKIISMILDIKGLNNKYAQMNLVEVE